MRVHASRRDLSKTKVDLAVCFAAEGQDHPRGVRDAGLREELARQMKADRFRARPGDRLVWSANGRWAARRYLVIGLGAAEGAKDELARTSCARATRAASEFAARSVAVSLPGEGSPEELRAAAEGALFGAYRFDRYLTEDARRPSPVEDVELVGSEVGSAHRSAVSAAQVVARAVFLARDLVNEAPSRLPPRELARRARSLARSSGIAARVYGRAEIEKIGMRALLAVGRGSAEPPHVVHLVYRPRARTRTRARVLLVGKGVTFDSGGLNLKPGPSMIDMKADMSGAAAVLATMSVLRELGCRSEVHGLLGLVENMTGAAAYKPGDVIETYSGKTVEVADTDAEGRLVLSDLLAWGVERVHPSCVVDLATLTGACVVALGTRAAGLFTRHEPLGQELLDSARAAGEKLWPLPMYDEYLQALQKGPADIRNVGERWGGAITAALFLGEFVPRKLPWAHLDIAGPAFTEADLPEAPRGGTGAGVPTLLRWLEHRPASRPRKG
jgi:leucyl aminopeptidase